MYSHSVKILSLEKTLDILKIRVNITLRQYKRATGQINTALEKWGDETVLLSVAQRLYRDSLNWDKYNEVNSQIEKKNPDNLGFKIGFGTTLLSLYQYENALSKLKYCIENWNLDPTFNRNLANIYARVAICYGYLGVWDSAELNLLEASKLTDWDPDMIYAQLLLYIGKGNVQKLEEYLDEQIKRHPDLFALYYWKGLYIQYFSYNLQAASVLYEQALRRIPNNKPRRKYWDQFFSPQHYAASWRVYKQSIKIYVRTNQLTRAMGLIYSGWIRMLVTSTEARALLALFYIEQKMYTVAEKICIKMLKKNIAYDDKVEFWLTLAIAQTMQTKFEDGLFSVAQALNIDSTSYSALRVLGFIQLQKNDRQSALQTYQKMARMNRFDFRCWRDLGLCQFNTGDLSSSQISYEQAVQINPFDADTWVDLANIYIKLNRKDLAFSAYQNGLKYDWLNVEKRKQALQAIDQIKSE